MIFNIIDLFSEFEQLCYVKVLEVSKLENTKFYLASINLLAIVVTSTFT